MYIKVHVTPGAKKESITKDSNDVYSISVKEPAKQNQANRRVIDLLAEMFSCNSSQVRMVTGHRSRSKMFSIDL